MRWSRGQKGSFQRLELGPGDDDAVFLDNISLHVGQEPEPLEGGYQLIKEMEVGPLIATAPTSPPSEGEFLVIPAGVPIDSRTTGVCEDVNTLKAEHARATAPKPAPRRPPGA